MPSSTSSPLWLCVVEREITTPVARCARVRRKPALASFGSDHCDVIELIGNDATRVLKGEKPADLPVEHAFKFEPVLNRKTAKALGIEISPILLATTDDVIKW